MWGSGECGGDRVPVFVTECSRLSVLVISVLKVLVSDSVTLSN